MTRAKTAAPSTLQAMEPEYDAVFRPAHYTQYHGVECKDVSSRMPAAEGQAVQYLWRYTDKGAPEADLLKGLQWLYQASNIHYRATTDNFDAEYGADGDEITYGVMPPWQPEADETLKKYVMLAVQQMPALVGSAILHIYRQDYPQAVNCMYALLNEVNPDRFSPPTLTAGKSASKKRVTKKAKR